MNAQPIGSYQKFERKVNCYDEVRNSELSEVPVNY